MIRPESESSARIESEEAESEYSFTQFSVGTYRLGETHQPVKLSCIICKLISLLGGNSESVLVESKTSDVDVVGNDITSDCTGAIGDLERLLGVDKRRRGLRTQESVLALIKNV